MVGAARLKPVMSSPQGRARTPATAAASAVSGAAGALVSVAALMLGVALAVVFAATLAFVMVLASVLLVLAAVALRVQRRPSLRGAAAVSHGAGHAWVAYHWDRRGR